ncbi:hypothetical protein SOPP22_16155 [Shewanella sp. OPT22]|nr:hypothetical protein SOPP22_16155 [Shewanella sp. OPT22]
MGTIEYSLKSIAGQSYSAHPASVPETSDKQKVLNVYDSAIRTATSTLDKSFSNFIDAEHTEAEPRLEPNLPKYDCSLKGAPYSESELLTSLTLETPSNPPQEPVWLKLKSFLFGRTTTSKKRTSPCPPETPPKYGLETSSKKASFQESSRPNSLEHSTVRSTSERSSLDGTKSEFEHTTDQYEPFRMRSSQQVPEPQFTPETLEQPIALFSQKYDEAKRDCVKEIAERHVQEVLDSGEVSSLESLIELGVTSLSNGPVTLESIKFDEKDTKLERYTKQCHLSCTPWLISSKLALITLDKLISKDKHPSLSDGLLSLDALEQLIKTKKFQEMELNRPFEAAVKMFTQDSQKPTKVSVSQFINALRLQYEYQAGEESQLSHSKIRVTSKGELRAASNGGLFYNAVEENQQAVPLTCNHLYQIDKGNNFSLQRKLDINRQAIENTSDVTELLKYRHHIHNSNSDIAIELKQLADERLEKLILHSSVSFKSTDIDLQKLIGNDLKSIPPKIRDSLLEAVINECNVSSKLNYAHSVINSSEHQLGEELPIEKISAMIESRLQIVEFKERISNGEDLGKCIKQYYSFKTEGNPIAESLFGELIYIAIEPMKVQQLVSWMNSEDGIDWLKQSTEHQKFLTETLKRLCIDVSFAQKPSQKPAPESKSALEETIEVSYDDESDLEKTLTSSEVFAPTYIKPTVNLEECSTEELNTEMLESIAINDIETFRAAIANGADLDLLSQKLDIETQNKLNLFNMTSSDSLCDWLAENRPRFLECLGTTSPQRMHTSYKSQRVNPLLNTLCRTSQTEALWNLLNGSIYRVSTSSPAYNAMELKGRHDDKVTQVLNNHAKT